MREKKRKRKAWRFPPVHAELSLRSNPTAKEEQSGDFFFKGSFGKKAFGGFNSSLAPWGLNDGGTKRA